MTRVFPPLALPTPVSILMPVCNEAAIIETVVEEWMTQVFRHLPEGSEFLFDEAASTDGTREILQRLAEKYPAIQVESRARRDGYAAAMRRLYARARCPWIFATDSDGQYVAGDFWKLAKHIDQFDIIRGAKIGRKDPLFRRLGSSAFNIFTCFWFNLTYLDMNCAFHLVRREALSELLPQLVSMPTLINTEFILRAELSNYSIRQVYVLHRSRRFGVSKGLPSWRFALDGARALYGLYLIKKSYRVEEALA